VSTIVNLYNRKIAAEELMADDIQLEAIHSLHALHQQLETVPATWTAYGKVFRWHADEHAMPNGFYFYGTVGRGKSMLMDLFFQFPTLQQKRRVHFHAFMDELHERMHNLKTTDVDPIHQVACDIAAEARLLCFDEFYISNIADAMMLGRLFEKLKACGVTVCATSNWKPEDLFTGGHNRVRFKPFIKAIENMMNITNLGNGTDYRSRNGTEIPHFFIGANASDKVEQAFGHFSAEPAMGDKIIDLGDFKLPIKQHSTNVLHASFEELCGNPLSPGNYLHIAKHYDTVIIEDIPQLDAKLAEKAMRFVVLIDILYENKRRAICSSEIDPEELCTDGDIAFAFQRTLSRLREMGRD
jgi:cell division protein ZapE